MSLLQDIKRQYNTLNIAEKLIAFTTALFICSHLGKTLFKTSFFNTWFSLSENTSIFITRPWTLISYAFLHADLWHLFFNMLMLYVVGKLFLTLFNNKQFINVYILGAIIGGIVFVTSYNLFPGLVTSKGALIGASAAVTAILIFLCTYAPTMQVRLFTFSLDIWKIGAFFVVLDLLRMAKGDNIGGYLSHLGGALLGYIYAKQLAKGNDIGAFVSKTIHVISSMFRKKTYEKKAQMRTVHKKTSTTKRSSKSTHLNTNEQQKKIDVILDKISTSGYDRLSQKEKDFLFSIGKDN